MFVSSLLLPAVLLSLRTAPVRGAASPLLTFEDRDPFTGQSLACDRCPPGTYLRSTCSATRKSVCAPCPEGSFTELWNHIGRCLRCAVCSVNQEVKTECSAKTDCQCQCVQGYYYKEDYDMCVQHSDCPLGQGVLTEGTPDHDTVCSTCSNSTFSDVASAHLNCTEHKSCDAGTKLVMKGAIWHNSVCANCRELQDGAVYLKEIIPAFFKHHKMNVKRLRRIVHKLPSEDGKRQEGTSGLHFSGLHARISTWVASATAKQIRELPAVVTKAGASVAGERLQNKLHRIDAELKEQCDLGNEVEVVVRPAVVDDGR